MGVHIGCIDIDRLFGHVAGAEGNFFQQFFQYGMQTAGADIFGSLIHLPAQLGNALDTVSGKGYIQAFCRQQRLILFGQ